MQLKAVARLVVDVAKLNTQNMLTSIKTYCDSLVKNFDLIPLGRKIILEKITQYIAKKNILNQPVNLVYICTHNSRRSHFGQVWAQLASRYYAIGDVYTFSGGTEATAFNTHAIHTLERIGFAVKTVSQGQNPVYHIAYDKQDAPILGFSKVYDDPVNPYKDFAAIMTCSDTEENCPFIPGVELRVGTTYDDPKKFDNTPLQDAMYDERCRQIALETFYVFSKVKA
jgi:arsenate reductase